MKLVFRPGGRYGLCPEKKVNIKLEKNKLTGKKIEKNSNQFAIEFESQHKSVSI